VFFALTPMAGVALRLVAVATPSSRDPGAPPADRGGLVLSTAAMAALVYTVIEAPDRGWTSGVIIGGFVAAAALLVDESNSRIPF
jgi:hypothetical protein